MSFSRKASVWVGGDPSQVPLPVTVTSHRCVQAKQHFRPPPIHLHQDSALLPIFDNFIFLLLGFIYEPESGTSGTYFLQDTGRAKNPFGPPIRAYPVVEHLFKG